MKVVTGNEKPSESGGTDDGVTVDIMRWLGRCTLDVIGLGPSVPLLPPPSSLPLPHTRLVSVLGGAIHIVQRDSDTSSTPSRIHLQSWEQLS